MSEPDLWSREQARARDLVSQHAAEWMEASRAWVATPRMLRNARATERRLRWAARVEGRLQAKAQLTRIKAFMDRERS